MKRVLSAVKIRLPIPLVISLLAYLVVGITVVSVVPASATVACDAGVAAQNNITVTPKHGKIFYVDSGQGQNVDAAYVAYKIAASSAKTNIWAKVDSFTGGYVSLANPADASLPVGDISASGSQTAFFLMKAKGSSLSAQAHTLHVFSGQPGLTGSSELYSCVFTFSKVSETIKAAANKVTAITPSVTTYVLGGTMTVVVEGASGTIGAGPTSDPNMMWISPVSKSSWPTSALRLTSTAVEFWTNANRNSGFHVGTASPGYVNQLQFTSLSSLGSKLFYTATCTYTPVASTILTVGSSSLSVTCDPGGTTYSAGSATVTIVVNAKPITVTAAAKTKVYGASDPTLTYTTGAGQLVGSDSLSGSLSRTAGEHVGSYAISQGTVLNSNYSITYVGDTLTVTTKFLTLPFTADDKQYDRGTSATLHGGTLSGVLSADASNVSVDSSKLLGTFASATVGSGKTVTVVVASGALTGSAATDYALNAAVNPTASITKASATVTGNSTGIAPSTVIFTAGGSAITLPGAGSLLRAGFTFAGWSTTSSGSAVISPYSPSASIILYARWVVISPTPTPTPTVIKEVTPGVSVATENGINVPTTIKILPSAVAAEKPKGVEISGGDWMIQITGSKEVVQGTPTDPTSISIVLIQGLDASTTGAGFKPGTVARVFLFSSPIFLGEALVGPDRPVSKAKTRAAFALNRRVEVYVQK